MNKILITGGAGFIGCQLAKKLSEIEKNDITILDNLSRGKMDEEFEEVIKKNNVFFDEFDLLDTNKYSELDQDYDQIYHLAAIVGVKNVQSNPHLVLKFNAQSILNLLEWFVKSESKKLLFSSTSEVYAWTNTFYELPIPTAENVPLSVDDPKNARATYAISKIFGEMAVINYCKNYGKDYSIVRFHNIYGPRMGMEHVIPELFSKARSNAVKLEVYSVNNTRSFCFIDDCVDATMRIMESSKTNGEIINVGNDEEEIKIGELAKKILDVVGVDKDIEPLKLESDKISRRCPDITKLKEFCGYKPKVCLDEGLKITFDWYKKTFL